MKHGHKPQSKAAKSVKKASGAKNGKSSGAVKAKSSRPAVKSSKAGGKIVVKAATKAASKVASKVPGRKTVSKAGPQSSKVEVRTPAPKIAAGRKAADQKHDPRAITFTNPLIGHAFRRAVKKYPVALKRLSD